MDTYNDIDVRVEASLARCEEMLVKITAFIDQATELLTAIQESPMLAMFGGTSGEASPFSMFPQFGG